MILLLPATIAAALAVVAVNSSSSPARAEQTGLSTGEICARYIAEAEKRLDIPSQLLLAIAMVKSGVWDRERARNIAWPWTVYARQNGHRFASKAEALVKIRENYNQGVRNIDIGCMQINLQYHAHAFGSFEELLDPASNVAYAALLLKSLF
ncbi:MAG: transglycosylase SLT domain-containing protein [Proteobacteria bacterium]|nr:transglycosylase SLT domain-containing protein [Pseudomonadota bacterium]